MAKRFHAEIASFKGTLYTIEIHDSSFAGTSTEFKAGGDGFTLSWDADNEVKPGLVPSSVTFSMLIQVGNKTAIEGLASDLNGAAEGRFQVRILKGNPGVKYWVGNVLSDTSGIDDVDPGTFRVTAADGLGAMDGLEYKDTGGAYTGWDTVLEHIIKCLKKTTALETFYTTDVALHVVSNWYEDSHSTATTAEPLALTRVRHERFYTVKSISLTEYSSVKDVIEDICRRFLLRIYQCDGVFVIEQITERDNSSNIVRQFTKDGTYVTNSSSSYDVTFNQTSEARLGGGEFGWFPALSVVREKYNSEERYNYLAGASWSDSNDSEYTAFLDIESSGGTTTLGISGVHTRTFTRLAGYTGNADIIAVFRVRVQVGSYYLHRNLLQINGGNVTYSSAEWSTDAGWYYFHYDYSAYNFPTSAGQSVTMPGLLSLITPAIPTTGTLKVKIEAYGHRQKSDGAVVDDLSYTLTWSFSAMTAQVYTNGNPASISDYTWYVASNSNAVNNSSVVEYETMIGDGKSENDLGKLQVYDGSAWSDSTQWRVGTSGSWLKLQNLTVKQWLALRSGNARRWSGTVRSTAVFRSRVYFDGSYWLALQGKYVAKTDEFDGVFWEVAVDPTPVSIGNEAEFVDNNNPLSGLITPPGGQGGGAPNVAGSVANAVSSTTLDDDVPAGNVTSIATPPLTGGTFQAGDTIKVVNVTTGGITVLTVTADVVEGDTSVQVQGYAGDTIPAGSPIIYDPKSQTEQSGGTGGSPGGSSNNTSSLQQFFEQFFTYDSTNDASWRIEVPDIVLETDEQAGDGSTAGVRFDGDGLKAYTSSSSSPSAGIVNDGSAYFLVFEIETSGNAGDGLTAGVRYDSTNGLNAYKVGSSTATVAILTTGVWELRSSGATGSTASGIIVGSDSGLRAYKSTSTTPTFYLKSTGELLFDYQGHPTVQQGLFYAYNGIIYLDHDGGGTKVHPQFGHIKTVEVLDFGTAWSTGIMPGFWRVPAEYAGFEVYKWSIGVGNTAGSGTGTNSVTLKHQDEAGATTTSLDTVSTLGTTTKVVTSSFTGKTLAEGDILYLDVSSVKSTPAEGAVIDLYLRKP